MDPLFESHSRVSHYNIHNRLAMMQMDYYIGILKICSTERAIPWNGWIDLDITLVTNIMPYSGRFPRPPHSLARFVP